MIEIYCGPGRGKTAMAIGQSLKASVKGKSVIVIQFLKGSEKSELDFLEKLDRLDVRIFRFERQSAHYQDLSEEERQEESTNILNGLNFARKVIVTRECDMLVLDEILGVVQMGIASAETVEEILKQADSSMQIVLTGQTPCPELERIADSVTRIETVLGNE